MNLSTKIIITGASRGLGLALVEVFLNHGAFVIALCREPEKADLLSSLTSRDGNTLRILKCDLSDDSQITEVGKHVSNTCDHIDLIINNAAVMFRDESIASFKKERFMESMAVNTYAPLAVANSCMPLLNVANKPKIINISSSSGIVGRVKSFNRLYSYKASKAALNMLTRVLAFELKEKGVAVASLDPGWMRTKMGGQDATGTTERTAMRILRIAQDLTIAETGSFFRWDDGWKIVNA